MKNDEKAFRCAVCGYIHIGEEAPEMCPVCGALKCEFKEYHEPTLKKAKPAIKRWKCINCSYEHKGEFPPDICPVCSALKEKFEGVEETENINQAAAVNVVIIGAGIAGISAAETIRANSPDSRITVISYEDTLPYYRLNLTRYIGGEIARENLSIHMSEWYVENRIEFISGVWAERIDRDAKCVMLMNGDKVVYDKLIIATGSHAFYPPLSDTGLEGVFTLRTSEDADEIIMKASKGDRCICIGGGILGIETAGAIARRGADVTLLEKYSYLMPRQLNKKAAQILERHLQNSDVKIQKNSASKEIKGNRQVSSVELEDGSKVDAAMVILTTGVRPNTVIARKSGIDVNKGILVDNHMKTSAEDIYCAGDASEHNGTLYGTWAPAQYQGKIAALNALGAVTVFGGIPRSNTLKLLGMDLTSIGKFNPEDGSDTVIEKEDGNSYLELVFRDGRIVGAILLGYAELAAHTKKAIDESADFTDLIKSGDVDKIIETLKIKY